MICGGVQQLNEALDKLSHPFRGQVSGSVKRYIVRQFLVCEELRVYGFKLYSLHILLHASSAVAEEDIIVSSTSTLF